LNLDKYCGDGDYVHVDEPPHVRVLSNYLLLSLIFLGYELGFDSSIFALSVAVALIVMYDASGVRKSAGIQAAEINKLSKKLDPQSELLLKETLGHTKIEVMVGSFLGPLITLPGMFFLGSPLKIFDLIIN